MTERHEVAIIVNAQGAQRGFKQVADGAKQVTADLRKLGPAGKGALDQVSTSSRTATASLEEMGAVTGAALGTVIGALAKVGAATVEHERQIDGLTRAYGASADEIIAFANLIQGTTIFSNEDAREALRIMATLQQQYGLTTEQVKQLTTVTADLASITGISLADAAQRTSSAIRGETESAEYLGLALNQQAIDREGLTLTMTNQEAAQFRLNALLEQSAFAEGAAGDRAATAAGQVVQMGNAFQDAAVGVGEFLGPVAEIAAPLAQVALVLPLVGTGLGKVAANAKVANAASAAFGLALNPIALGLGAVAVAATAAIAIYKNHEQGLADLAAAYDDVNRAILENINVTNQAAAAQIQFQSFDVKTPLDFAPWTEAGAKIDDFMARYPGFVGAIDDIILTTAEAAKVQGDWATAMANVVSEGQQPLIAASARLQAAYDSEIASAQDVIDIHADLASIYTETGIRGEIAQQAIAEINAEFARTGDVYAYKQSINELQADLGDLAIAAGTAEGAVISFTDAQKAAIGSLPGILASAADAQIAVAQETEDAITDAADAAADATIAAAERSGEQRTRAAEKTGRAESKAAEQAADQQIAAAESAEEAQVAAAERAAEDQIAAAQAAEESQVKAAERAANAQVREAEKAANAQIRQAGRLEESVAASAKAQEEAIVEAARAAHAERVDQADAAAEAEINAARRSTDQQLFELERLTAARQRAATEATGETLQAANDAAFKRIQAAEKQFGAGTPGHERVVGEEANKLARAQEQAYAREEKAQEAALRKEEEGQQQIAATEEQRIAQANAQKEAATEASAARLAQIEERAQAESLARTEAASRTAEKMRTDAARNVAQVERETSRDTARVAEQAAARTAAVEEAAALNTERVREQAALNTERVRTQAANNITRVEQENARTLRVIARETAREVKAAEDERAAVHTRSTARMIEEEEDVQAEMVATRDQAILTAASLDPVAATAMEARGWITKDAKGEWTVIIDEPGMEAVAVIKSIFGPDAAELTADGRISVTADLKIFKEQLAPYQTETPPTVGVAEIEVRAAGVAPPSSRSTPSGGLAPGRGGAGGSGEYDPYLGKGHGGVIPSYGHGGILSAANGRVVTVGEWGREQVILPAGSLVRPHPATEASLGAGGGITFQFNGPVYGMDDFETKVIGAAARLLDGLPAAMAERRRQLGG